MQAEHYNGLIAVWKEQGYTSHDVVAKLRGILHQKKIGHLAFKQIRRISGETF